MKPEHRARLRKLLRDFEEHVISLASRGADFAQLIGSIERALERSLELQIRRIP